jgi:hypothetical protein
LDAHGVAGAVCPWAGAPLLKHHFGNPVPRDDLASGVERAPPLDQPLRRLRHDRHRSHLQGRSPCPSSPENPPRRYRLVPGTSWSFQGERYWLLTRNSGSCLPLPLVPGARYARRPSLQLAS